MDLDAFKALLGVVAGALGKNQTELLSALVQDGKPKSAEDIKSYVNPLFTAKFKGLVPADKLEQMRLKGVKQGKADIEKLVKEKFDIEGFFDNGLIDKLQPVGTKPTTVDPEDYKNSDVHKDLLKAHKLELQKIKKDNQEALHAEKMGRVEDKLYEKSHAFLKDPKNKFMLPPSESILKKQLNLLVKEVLGYKYEDKPINVSIDPETRDIIATDADGLPLKDESMKNDLSIYDIVKQTASTGYFAIQEASGRQTTTTKPAGSFTTIKVAGDKELKLPVAITNKSEFQAYMQSPEVSLKTPAERQEIRNAFEGKFEESE